MQVFFNSDGTSVTAYITIIDTSGAHVDPDSWPITNDPAIVLSSHPSASKTVTAVDTGVYKVVWTGLSPALSHGDVVHISIDGAISGTAWSTWIVPIQVVLLPPVNGATVNANVASMDADTLTASALAADAVAEIAASVDISSQLAAVIEDTEDIQSRLPAALVSGRINASVGAMAADTLSASALASDAVAEIADAVWDEPYAAHKIAGTFGKLMDIIHKANLSIDGATSGTPTVNTFDSDLTDADAGQQGAPWRCRTCCS